MSAAAFSELERNLFFAKSMKSGVNTVRKVGSPHLQFDNYIPLPLEEGEYWPLLVL